MLYGAFLGLGPARHGVRGATLRDQQLCLELLAAGKINPIIDRAYPLEEAAEAHAYLESHRQTAKYSSCPDSAPAARNRRADSRGPAVLPLPPIR
ncbi:zinc-binding dehydrogenase [Streptomyces canus]|uniref:zinc-binding dehydrogenase n=1 Tax=Streptomyces canus TaxID=58343 RepID=UPI000A442F5F|nr:zinc-binding dehydrogenase [Streptomyces canus]